MTQTDSESAGASCGRFWRYVTSRSESERALLLKFCSGSSRVPCGGFSQLQGLAGPCLFTLACVGGGDDRLPMASTCFNLLKVAACLLN